MGPVPIEPNPEWREFINRSAHADNALCLTCSTCDNECPVNWYSNCLKPRKIVWMANLGMLNELLDLPDLWHCIGCKRCNHVCPSLVKPADLIEFLREEALRQKRVTWQAFEEYRCFFSRFQRVRWQAVFRCMKGVGLGAVSEEQWSEWLNAPVALGKEPISGKDLFSGSKELTTLLGHARGSECFTCSACTNACPLKGERAVFDPQWIVRMANLGLEKELLKSPAIWLCIACGRCTDACSESVEVHSIIERLVNLAVESGTVASGFRRCLNEAYKSLYPRFVRQIDAIFGRSSGHSS
jgi:heterodisulfide reductase subunit C